MKKVVGLVVCLFLVAGVSFAENSKNANNCAKGKFGLGYSKVETSITGANIGFDSVACRYWFNDDLGLDATLGFRAGDGSSGILIGAKIIGNVYKYKIVNIYWLGGLAIGSYDPKIDGFNSSTLIRVQGGLGAEVFVLPCLSVLTEVGLQFWSASGNGNSINNFGVYADWLPQAGVRFYFK